MITVVLQIQDSSQDTSEKARVVLEGVPGVRRVLMDPVGRALVVRGDQRPGDLRRILSDAGMHSTIVSASSLRPILKRMDNAAIAVLILAAQLVLTRWSFGVDRAFLHAAQAGASAFVFAVLGFPLLRAAATSALQKSVSLELVIVVGAFCAWVAGALSAIRLEGLAQPYSVLASVSVVSGLFAQSVVNISRARAGDRLRRILQLTPDRATLETRRGTQDVASKRLGPGRIVRVDTGRRFPLDGTLLSGDGDVDESAIAGEKSLYACGPGDVVLAGSTNLGEPRRVKATSRVSDAAVSLLATLAIGAGSKQPMARNRYSKVILTVFSLLLVVAVVFVGVKWYRTDQHLELIETGFLIVALGAPASFVVSGSFIYVLTIAMLRRWGIWVRDPSAIEDAMSIRVLAVVTPGIMTEGEKRILKTFATGGDIRRILAFADAALQASGHEWETKIHTTVLRAEAEPHVQHRLELVEADGVVGYVNDGNKTFRVTVGTQSFMSKVGIAINPNFVETKLTDIPDAIGVYVGLDGHVAGTVWMSDPFRQTAHGAVRSIRARGLETCLIGDGDPSVLKQRADLIGVDSFLAAANSEEMVAQVNVLQSRGARVALVGHSVNDAAALASADLGIGFGELTSPASARPGFLLRHRDPLLVSSCFHAARAVRRRVWQSMALASLPALGAIGMAVAGTMSLKAALVFTAAGLLLVAGNSARMLVWRPRFRVSKR